MKTPSIRYINLLSQSLETRFFDLSDQERDALLAATLLKTYALSSGQTGMRQIAAAEARLEQVLKPALQENSKIYQGDEDVVYAVNGHKVKFKIDTGTKPVVVDARNIQWDKKPDERIKNAHLTYAEAHPNSGNLTKEKLVAFSPEYADIDFGVVEQFDMALHEGKDDADYQAVTLVGPFPVVAVSRPKNTSGKRAEEMRPVIGMTLQREGFSEEVRFPVNLVARKELTRRGLLGKEFLEDKVIVFGDQDTRMIDFAKVDFNAVVDVLRLI